MTALLALILFEVDLGTTALIGMTSFVIMFVAGTNPILLGLLAMIGSSVIFVAATHARMDRLVAFTNLERYKEDAGLQQMQALIAWGSGGMDGLGLGNGRQKMLYLPYAHTDFIFPMIGEELGLRVSLLVVFLFVVVIVCGIVIALHAKDRFGLLTVTGVVSLLALQAAVNIGVTTSLLPNKGLPLPFISYGGSNLVACLFGVGLLLNIYRQAILEPANKKRTALQVRITPRFRGDQQPLMNAIIACGGTGGHLFPGIAVAEVLRERGHEVLLFVSEKEIDSLALSTRSQFRFEKLPTVGFPSLYSPRIFGFVRTLHRKPFALPIDLPKIQAASRARNGRIYFHRANPGRADARNFDARPRIKRDTR